jgi:predicted ATPase/class 3 adenylate cyclase
VLPTGTVTFLFTDIEGSTRLWERYPHEARAALARHDGLVEQLVSEQHGWVVRPRGEGDSRFAVFARASDAVAAACAIQRAFAIEPWPTPVPLRARIALHTGSADLRDGDYYGSDVNRCARLRAVAHGGQTLLSGRTAELAQLLMPSGASLRALGQHRLKDLEEPEQIFQLLHPDLPAEFPALKSVRELPTGTVTFVFTDIEGSTRLLGRHPDAYPLALARHDSILRVAVETNGGCVFETIGDAFYAAFAVAGDAVAAVLEAQLALRAEDWGEVGEIRVRMGLHTGQVELRGDHYFGAALYRCARLMATGYGGQVLLSRTTAELVREELGDSSLRGLGTHRLKDLAEPERIFQLVHPGLLAEFPPLKSLGSMLHNLPVELTSFIGREQELGVLRDSLRDPRVRLITLTGPGGVGKTRLSLRLARDVVDGFAGGVYFVPLAGVKDSDRVLLHITEVLGVSEVGDRPTIGIIGEALRDKQMLLVIDNFEHVTAAAPQLAELLALCPLLKLLVTSREVLRVSGEREFLVRTLGLPEADTRSPQRLLQSEAVRLFLDRAERVKPDLAPTTLAPEELRVVAQICVRLDGLPLALELAAARIRMLSPAQILGRLEQRLSLLTGGNRDLPERHRALRATIDWSHALLDARERRLFRRLSVFESGCTLEAAQAICAGANGRGPDLLDTLTSLVEKNLVREGRTVRGESRFDLLETIREYALERLTAASEAGRVRSRFMEFFVKEAETADADLHGPRQGEWLEVLELDHGNYRAALHEARRRSDVQTQLRLVSALWRFWQSRGHVIEGREHVERALSGINSAPPSLTATALNAAGVFAFRQGDYEHAHVRFERSLRLSEQEGDENNVAFALNSLGNVAWASGKYGLADEYYRESLALRRRLGDRVNVALCLNNLGTLASDRAQYEEARAMHEASLAQRRELGDQRGIAQSLQNLGEVALRRGEIEQAQVLYRESLVLFRDLGERMFISRNLDALARAAEACGDYAEAVRLFGAAAALRAAIGAPIELTDSAIYEHSVSQVRAHMTDAEFTAAWSEGMALPVDAIVEEALQERPSPVPA